MSDKAEQTDAEVEARDTADVYEGSILISPSTDSVATFNANL